MGHQWRDNLPVRQSAAASASPTNTSNSFGGGQRPNRTGISANLDGSAQSRLNQWFNTAAFSLPAAFTFGNSARTMPDVRSHGINNFDFTVFKNTKITERVGPCSSGPKSSTCSTVCRFGYPGTTLGTAQFGVVSGQYNDPDWCSSHCDSHSEQQRDSSARNAWVAQQRTAHEGAGTTHARSRIARCGSSGRAELHAPKLADCTQVPA